MKSTLLLAALFLVQIGMAQQFTELPSFALDGVEYSALAFADVDGDGDEDVLISGDRGPAPTVNPSTTLYRNDSGVFVKVENTPFEDVDLGAIAFSDIDGDGDQDVLITGEEADGTLIASLYTNAFGTFTKVDGTLFDGVKYSSVAFADVNGDNAEDLLITGQDKTGDHIAKLYINDQAGNFSELDEPFAGVSLGSVAFSDVDGDGDADVLVTGQNIDLGGVASLYLNDGMGNFTETTSSAFQGVYFSSVAFSDVDDDGDEDVIITGQVYSVFEPTDIAGLYLNNGSGVFTQVEDAPFVGVYESAIGFADVDGDGDEDVLISGETEEEDELTQLYINDGNGSFSVDSDNEFEGVFEGSIGFSDVDDDGDEDVLITGEKSNGLYIAHLYTNDGMGNYTQLKGIPFDDLGNSDHAIADVNGDGSLDVLITGSTDQDGETHFVHLYTNDGNGDFSEVLNLPFAEVSNGSADFADIDGDGDQDALITGDGDEGFVAELYRNNGSGHFNTIEQTTLVGVHLSASAFADVDGDGDPDLLITGANTEEVPISNLYLNDGNGNFTLSMASFEGVTEGSIAFADLNGNGHLDVILTGQNSSEGRVANLYTNDGMGNFTAATPGFTGVTRSDIAVGDVDGDSDLDVFLIGREGTGNNTIASKLYLNDGNAAFTLSGAITFAGVENGEAAFSDVDGDNDLDVLITGSDINIFPRTRLYLNDGTGVYTANSNVPFRNLDFSTATFFDMDDDGDEDLLMTGLNFNFRPFTRVYQNDRLVPLAEGAALDFDGVDDQVVIPTENLLDDINGDYTISAWVKIDNNTVNQPIFTVVSGLNGDYAPLIVFGANSPVLGNRPYIILNPGSGSQIVSGSQALSENEWHHLLASYDAASTTMVLYVDGEIAGSNSIASMPSDITNPFAGFIGYYPPGVPVSGYFNGQIDDLRILNKSSDCYDIAQLSNCELPADDPNLVLYYQFNQDIANSGVTTLDATVGPDGTMQNFALMGMGSDFVEEGAVETGTSCSPVEASEPSVSGQGMAIANGDNSPMEGDGTDFGDVAVGQTAIAVFDITNLGTGSFVIDTVISSNPAFEITTLLDSVIVNMGVSITLQVAFNPTAAGTQTSTITIVTNDCAVSEYTFSVQGNGVECIAPVINGINVIGCSGDNFTIEVDGELNGATEWQWTNNATGTTCEQVGFFTTGTQASGNYLILPNDTYYVRAVGGCLETPVCLAFIPNELIAEDLGVSFAAPGPFLNTDGLQPLTGGMPMGGTYSGTGVVDNGDGTFSFDPSIGAGIYTITYTYIDMNGCSASASGDITVEEIVLPPDNECGGANDINNLFGQAPNEPQTSGLFDNTGYNSTNDPANGFECFDDGTLERTTWYTFVGDGNTYQIKTVECNATNYLTNGDTQIAIYSGDCSNPSPEACNEDEDFANDIYNGNVELQTEAGVTYLMMIDGWTGANYSAEGEFCIEVTNLTEPVELTTVTFQVDASLLVADGTLSAEGIFLAGGFNDFNGEPMNEGADNIWTLTLDIQPGTYTYKFQNGLGGWETIDTSIGEDCTVGGYADREVVVEDMDLTTDLVCFGYCVTCDMVVDTDEALLEAGIEIFPNPTSGKVNINGLDRGQITVMDQLGRVVQEYVVNTSGATLDLEEIPAGVYLIRITVDEKQWISRIVKQ